MTTLIPSINSCLGRMTSGERRLARRFESHLEDDYLCWYDVPVGPKQQHPDFVILHPSRGLLVLEVKDWKLETIQRMDKQSATIFTDGGVKEVSNPLEQARHCTYAVIRPMQKDSALIHEPGTKYGGRLAFPFGYGVVLSRITRQQFEAQEPGEILPAHRVICSDEMGESVDPEEFQRRLWDMFTTYFDHALTLPQIDRIRWHLFPEIRIGDGPSTGELDLEPEESLPDILRVMDLQQEQLARSLGDGHRVIHGASGAGKTLILVYRCVHLARAVGKPILVLCYNVTLANRLQSLLAEKGLGEEQVQVRNFHKWCSTQLRTYHVPGPDQSLSGDEFFEGMVQCVIEGVDSGHIPSAQYGAVLIDEGHDFQPNWLRLAVQMVDPNTRSLLVLYDDAQSIYDRKKKFTFSSVGIEARGRTTILRVNYRNTQEILQLATQFARELLTEKEADEDGIPLVAPESAGRSGLPPQVVELPSLRQEMTYVADQLTRLNERGTAWRDMAVLHRRTRSAYGIAKVLERAGIPSEIVNRKRRLSDASSDTVKIITMHSSKGLEFPVVAMPGINRMPEEHADPSDEARILYVGMTRAMDQLIITGHEDAGFLQRLRQSA